LLRNGESSGAAVSGLPDESFDLTQKSQKSGKLAHRKLAFPIRMASTSLRVRLLRIRV
jgi:hypothetical protein